MSPPKDDIFGPGDSALSEKEELQGHSERPREQPDELDEDELETFEGGPEEDDLESDDLEDGGGPTLAKIWDIDKDVPDEVWLSRLESLIFVSEQPITVRRLARILGLDGRRIRSLLAVLTNHYTGRGIVLQEISGGFQFRTHPDNAAVIREVFKLRPLRLSRAALETLSIVAYRQPLTRAQAEDIRGVDCGGVLKFLFEKGLVRVIGRKEEPGRPIIYGTSQTFLELFGLRSLSDLPPLHEFSELWDEHKKMVDERSPQESRTPKPKEEKQPDEPVQNDTEPEPVEEDLEPDDKKEEP